MAVSLVAEDFMVAFRVMDLARSRFYLSFLFAIVFCPMKLTSDLLSASSSSPMSNGPCRCMLSIVLRLTTRNNLMKAILKVITN